MARRAVIADVLPGLMRLETECRGRQKKRQQTENRDERVKRSFHLLCVGRSDCEKGFIQATNDVAASILF